MTNIIPILIIAAAAVFVAYKFGYLDKFLKTQPIEVTPPKPTPVPVPVQTEVKPEDK